MNHDAEYVELTRVTDPIEADLLAAFLGDGDIDFMMVNRSGAGMMNALMPRAVNPVLLRVKREDYERGVSLLEEYRRLQDGVLCADDGIAAASPDLPSD